MKFAALPSTLILNVGQEWVFLNPRRLLLESVGHIVNSTCSIQDAINRFRTGDFDLVILCHSIPEHDQQLLIRLMRDYGSATPVISLSVSEKAGLHRSGFRGLCIGMGPDELLMGIREVLQDERSVLRHCGGGKMSFQP